MKRISFVALVIAMALALVASSANALTLTGVNEQLPYEAIFGSNGSDKITTSPFDFAFGKGGNDRITGDISLDLLLLGGPGRDIITAGPPPKFVVPPTNLLVDDDGTPGDRLIGRSRSSDAVNSFDGARDRLSCGGPKKDSADFDFAIVDVQDIVSKDCEFIIRKTGDGPLPNLYFIGTHDPDDISSDQLAIFGGRGDDKVAGGEGSLVYGGPGDDVLLSGLRLVDDDGSPGDLLFATSASVFTADGAADVVVCEGNGDVHVFADPEDLIVGSCVHLITGAGEVQAFDDTLDFVDASMLDYVTGDGNLGGHETAPYKQTICPIDKAVTGIEGDIKSNTGSDIDGTLTTARMMCEGGGAYGEFGSPGPSASTTCPVGEVAVGIEGREVRNHVAQVRVRCQAADLTGGIAAAAGTLGTATTGTNDGPYDCPAGTRLAGLKGAPINGGVTAPGFFQIVCNDDQHQLGDVPTFKMQVSSCTGGEPVTGITGRQGDISGNTKVLSAKVTCGDDSYIRSIGDDGTGGSTTCPDGQVAVGITGSESIVSSPFGGGGVDTLAVRCQAASLTGPVETSIGYGGPGGTVEGPFDCPAGQRLLGLDGSKTINSAGNHVVVHLEPVCAVPSDTTVTVKKGKDSVRATGSVAPVAPGDKVSVTLERNQGGSFVALRSQTVTIDSDGDYVATFKRKKKSQCRVIATYLGDDSTARSSASTDFAC